ncbi:MAG: hypothetical protein A3H70_02190 [Candidatus Komeilibacteria bacterium RIFCSPLOWO2_02_FULL_48_11]|uniref:TPM domain-containing protein n=1 Tax=Candidatus Komeilibacteria bacterium RIFCSPLOWO2_02_FULL_48_11 TaxID=1798553 RepID=A0A1G2BSA5_9BACT|nr:MAG: hypothetical protein A3H70_02190 [Candidatus Komeilibacteria bacterium RIFCSPLOWO2_02_FULL_48_11]
MKKYFLLLLLATLLPTVVFGYTSPGNPTGHINDFANVLSADAKSSLEELLSAYEQKSGHQLSVAIISELKDETIETYAEKLYQEWGIGQKGKDNGALFLVSVNDREMRIEVGYGLEGDLTDIEAKHLVSAVAPPYFRINDYDQGVRAGVVGMIQAIGGDINVLPEPKSETSQLPWGNYFWFAIFIFMWLTSILARSRSWWLGGVVGGVIGIIVWIAVSAWFWTPILVLAGLIFDYFVSIKYKQASAAGNFAGLWWLGGGKHPWDKGGGWGGFGGGSSGGGGASGRW